MKQQLNSFCKLLCLLFLSAVGYVLHPALFSHKNTPKNQTAKPNQTHPITQKNTTNLTPTPHTQQNNNTTKPKQTTKTKKSTIRSHAMTTKKIIPIPSNTEPNNLNPQPQPKPPSPIDKATIILTGIKTLSSKEIKKDEELIDRAAYHGEWEQYSSMLNRSITQALKKNQTSIGRNNARYDALWKKPKFYNAILRWKALSLFPNEALNLTKTLPGSTSFIKWLLSNNQALEEITLTLHPNDNKEKVFKFLSKIWQNKTFTHQEKELNNGNAKNLKTLIPKYFNLALACATVFDQDIPYKNPTTDTSTIDGLFRYHWYRDKNERGLLSGDIHKASAKDLTFVVCSPVSTKELEWALKEYRSTHRKNIGKAFQDIEYLMERALEDLNPYAEYTLQEILKEGGICGDQTYFCVNVARASGIPAFGLSGMTDNGPHAWAAVKTKENAWSTKIGRIPGVSKGLGTNLQTNSNIIEQQIWHWAEPKIASRQNTTKVLRHLWLADFLTHTYNELESQQAITIANNIGPEFPITWTRAYQVMLANGKLLDKPKHPDTINIWKKFVKKINKEFKKNPRMGSLSITVEDKHIYPHQELADIRRDLARMRRRNKKNAAEQSDIMTSSLQRESEVIIHKLGEKEKEKALEEIHQLYSRALRDYGGSISGFRLMITYYFSIMKNHPERGKTSTRTIELAFKRVIETGSGDWFRKKSEINIHKQIANMYRLVGEEKRAKNMEKRLARELKKAKRKAI